MQHEGGVLDINYIVSYKYCILTNIIFKCWILLMGGCKLALQITTTVKLRMLDTKSWILIICYSCVSEPSRSTLNVGFLLTFFLDGKNFHRGA